MSHKADTRRLTHLNNIPHKHFTDAAQRDDGLVHDPTPKQRL